MKICVSCPSGCEAVLKRELYKLGYGENPAINGRICFEGDIADIAKCNLFLRTANRVYIEIAQFKAKSFDELYDGVSQIDWLRYVSINGKFDVVAKCVDSTIHAISVTQSITKKAVSLCRRYCRNRNMMPARHCVRSITKAMSACNSIGII